MHSHTLISSHWFSHQTDIRKIDRTRYVFKMITLLKIYNQRAKCPGHRLLQSFYKFVTLQSRNYPALKANQCDSVLNMRDRDGSLMWLARVLNIPSTRVAATQFIYMLYMITQAGIHYTAIPVHFMSRFDSTFRFLAAYE